MMSPDPVLPSPPLSVIAAVLVTSIELDAVMLVTVGSSVVLSSVSSPSSLRSLTSLLFPGLLAVADAWFDIPPASTANSQDNTRNVESIEEETAVASNAGGQPTAVAPMNMGNLLDIKRESERPNEDLTAGAFVNNISPTQAGDLDYLVLADLADNSDVDALRQTFSF